MRNPYPYGIFFVLLVCAGPVLADEEWRFRLSPYIWFAGLKGDVATTPPLPAAPIDISSSDALSDSEASLMIILDAKKQRHGIYADLLYTDIDSDEELIPPPIDLNMTARSKTTIFTLAYQYEFYNQEQVVVDLLAGARYWNIDTELRFRGGLGILAGEKLSEEESWIDPLLGFKARAPLGDSQFYVTGGAGVGGFGVGSGSDLFYDISANVGYQWNKEIGTALGYRIFDVDYEDGDYIYDVKQEGWQVGLTWAF
jgi:hypothetical protein